MRIRTIKPEFFLHEGLYELEKETSLPVRLAFAGLWCAADREGRFKWEPRRLGVSILPYDSLDFSRVLDALASRGYLVKYAFQNAEFGFIPGFKTHQVVNPKEKASTLPEPSADAECDATATREGRDGHACHKEGKGKEQGREGKDATPSPAAQPSLRPTLDQAIDANLAPPEMTRLWFDECVARSGEGPETEPFLRYDGRPMLGWRADLSSFAQRQRSLAHERMLRSGAKMVTPVSLAKPDAHKTPPDPAGWREWVSQQPGGYRAHAFAPEHLQQAFINRPK